MAKKKKIIKKVAKKKAKKAVKKPVKKAAKKPAKKVVKKPAKKAPAKKQAKSKPKKAVKKPATKKKAPKAEKPKERYKRMKDGTLRVYGWRVASAPNTKFPELVAVENLKLKVQKRFITLEKAIKYIEERESEKLINAGGKSVIGELKSLGLGPAVDIIADSKADSKSDVSIETTGQKIEQEEAEEAEVDADQ